MSDDTLVKIHIRGLPVELHLRAGQHYDELFREFTLLSDETVKDAVPTRVLAFVEQVQTRYAGFAVGNRQEIGKAVAEGREAVDLVYRLPAAVGPVCADLLRHLEEADAFCRQGELLTLAAPPEVAGYVAWFLGEFIEQVEGRAPTPYRDPATAG
jgi:hypothetical protein